MKGTLKKQGGEVAINLRNFPINASNRITTIIQKSPLHNSTLELDFVFMKSDRSLEDRELVGQGELESITHQAFINEMTI